ncbi:hypothetical protein DV532_11525 [Pseudomonas sp. Leaf58]|nr:hypothetical protein DV532_11525 [Pseudomonas sp. Leaf58]
MIGFEGLFAGKPAPTTTALVSGLARSLVGAGLPAKAPVQATHAENPSHAPQPPRNPSTR